MHILPQIALSGLCAGAFIGCYESHVVEVDSPGAAETAGDHSARPPQPTTRTGAEDVAVPFERAPGATRKPPPRVPSTPPGSPLRFVALGDGGTGGDAQYAVAAALKQVCAREGCDFALYLGDNIYESGVSSPDDSQFQSKFEAPYAALDFPFYVVLGNHDYGPYALEQAEHQVAYTERSDKWVMPSRHYTFRVGPVAFFALDTNAILHDGPRDLNAQRQWLQEALARSDAPWAIAFGHHPYISNGFHGSAGRFDGYTDGALSGQSLADLVEDALCGRVQLYLAGHDHDREWLEPQCDTHFVVSGAAAKLRPIAHRGDHASRWDDAEKHGFLWVEVDDDTLRGVFYDEDGKANYEDRIVLKNAP